MQEVTKLHYKLLVEYKNQLYANVLTTDDIVGDKKHINKVVLPGGREFNNYDLWGFVLKKDKTKYLLNSMDSNRNPIDINNLLPIYPEGLQLISYKGDAYNVITEPVPARIRPENILTFKEIVDRLSSIETTNHTHRKLMVIIVLLQRVTRMYARFCSVPGSLKDSTVDVVNFLVGKCDSVADPSRAKLEFMASLRLLVINEVSSIKADEWAKIQNFLLNAGAGKPRIQKSTRKTDGVEEELNIEKLSIGLYYNDITEYHNQDNYFDNKADGNVIDRFVSFRFNPVATEDFSLIRNVIPADFVKENMQYYRDMTQSILYIEENYDSLITNNYSKPDISKYSQRWRDNLNIIFDGIELYSKSQEEFDSLTSELFKCMEDYNAMLNYPIAYENLMIKMDVPEEIREKGFKYTRKGSGVTTEASKYFSGIVKDKNSSKEAKASASRKLQFLKAVIEEPTFTVKNILCHSFVDNERAVVSKGLDDW